MSNNNQSGGGNGFPPFQEFRYYGSLLFSYNQEKFDRVRVAKDYDAAAAFFNDYIRQYNAYWQKRGFKVNRELSFVEDVYETDCKKYFRITAFLKPALVSKKRNKKGTARETYVPDANEQPISDNQAAPKAMMMAADGPGGGGVTPREPKGPPVTSEAVTSAPEEQNYNSGS